MGKKLFSAETQVWGFSLSLPTNIRLPQNVRKLRRTSLLHKQLRKEFNSSGPSNDKNDYAQGIDKFKINGTL
jgi:hypothetical protein